MSAMDLSQKPLKLILPISDIKDQVYGRLGQTIPDGSQYRYIGKALDIFSTIVITGDSKRDHEHLENQMMTWNYDVLDRVIAHCLYQYIQEVVFENGIPSAIIHKATYNTTHSTPLSVVVDIELLNFKN